MSAVSLEWSPAPVGFVWHYPYIQHEDEKVGLSGAVAVISRAPISLMKEDGSIDFSPIDKQIELAGKSNLKIVLLVEANTLYAPEWLKRKCKEAGENAKTMTGADAGEPSLASSLYAQYRKRYVKALTEHVKKKDTEGTVIAYNPGCEWWYVAPKRGSELETDALREWLKIRNKTINNLNKAWGSHFSHFEEIRHPGMEVFEHDAAWSLHQPDWIAVKPGQRYRFSAWVSTGKVEGAGAHLSIAWWGNGGTQRLHDDYSEKITGSHDWQKIEMTGSVPERADRAWLLLKLRGEGTVQFDDVGFYLVNIHENLAPCPDIEQNQAEKGPWFPDNWTGGKQVIHSQEPCHSGKGLVIRAEPQKRLTNSAAAFRDSSRFASEFLGDYIEGLCTEIKGFDDSRPTAGYLTYSFSNPVEWDYVGGTAMNLGVILPRLRHLDIIGMQICSADGDPIRITASLDLARKYGKPMWAIDLLDFTTGVAIGSDTMRKVTQSAIQHGATGLFYYCWHGTPDYNYYPGMSLDELKEMQTEAVRSIEFLKGMKPKTSVAIILPMGGENDFKDFFGLYKAVQDLEQFCDVWTLEELEQPGVSLAKYNAVVLPDCAWISSRAAAVLADYSRRGLLIRSGRWATHDDYGTARKEIPHIKALFLGEHWGSDYLGDIQRTTHAGNTPPLYVEIGDPQVRAITRAKLRSHLEKLLNIEASETRVLGGGSKLKQTIFEGNDRRAVFLVNESSISVNSARMQFDSNAENVACRALADGMLTEDIRPAKTGSRLNINLPPFKHSCIIEYRTIHKE